MPPMLYLDYLENPGVNGFPINMAAKENLEAIDFMKKMNEVEIQCLSQYIDDC